MNKQNNQNKFIKVNQQSYQIAQSNILGGRMYHMSHI